MNRPLSLVLGVLALATHGCGAASMRAAPVAEASITNNQEAGVDEGGIVKAWRDHLVVLRRGRLFTVRVAGRRLDPVCMLDAFAPGSNSGTWYDEMLIHDDRLVVVGYSYQVGATEIGLFQLTPDGCVHHVSTQFLRSNDYYSSRNYASRLVDGKLVFYMPHYVGSYTGWAHDFSNRWAPAMRTSREQTWHPVLTSARVRVPEMPTDAMNTVHTVVSCDLSRPGLDCRGQGIFGGMGRTFYVSSNAVYVWVEGADRAPAAVYRLPLDGSNRSGAVHAWGMPTDQFSFDEGDDGSLNVLVRANGHGDGMWGPEHSSGAIALVSIPHRAFTDGGTVAADAYTPLPRPDDDRPLQNRFVGRHVLYGTGTSWGWPDTHVRAHLFVHKYDGRRGTSVVDLPHGVDRIEALGDDAVVIGSDGSTLNFTSIALDADPRSVDRFVRPNASQGELRSHGFFFLPQGQDDGMLGLPVRTNGPGFAHLYQGSAEIQYLAVDDLRFSNLGALAAELDRTDDHCVASCVDWYGNARPIFYRSRVFALLGYELVEGSVRNGQIHEVQRTHLIRDLARGPVDLAVAGR